MMWLPYGVINYNNYRRCLPDIVVATHHSRLVSESPTFGETQHYYLQSDVKVLHFTR